MATCSNCNEEIIHVRDSFTGATFPVDAEPKLVKGFALGQPGPREKNPRASYQEVEVFTPHAVTCAHVEQTDLVPEADE